jgi:hypothetical protein
MGEYNGGPGIVKEAFTSEQPEAQRYQVYGKRFFVTAEIAARMRNKKISDPQLEYELISEETDARAYAFQQFVGASSQGKAYHDLFANMGNKDASIKEQMEGYQVLWLALSKSSMGLDMTVDSQDVKTLAALGITVTPEAATQLAAALNAYYDKYLPKNSPVHYTYPVSPALRLWLSHGGSGLFERPSTPTNPNPNINLSNYPKGTYLS